MKYRLIALTMIISIAAVAVYWGWVYHRIEPVNKTVKAADIPPPPQFRATSLSFLAVGDIMLSRGVAAHIQRTSDPLTPFKSLASLFQSTDFNFGNLESPVSGHDDRRGAGLVFNAATRNIAGLIAYNFKMVNLANNHAMDQGFAGNKFTRDYLTENSISFVGTGDDLDEAWRPKVVTANDLKVGFVGCSYASVNDGGVTRNNFVARIEDTERLKAAIVEAKKLSDFVVVTMHAGIEYQRHPHKSQIDFAHAAVDFGADIVIGAHPHWVQDIETYKGKYIFYSLGNFIFDQGGHQDTKEALAIKVTIDRDVKGLIKMREVELIPAIIENFSTPRLAKDEEAERILAKIDMKEKVLKN